MAQHRTRCVDSPLQRVFFPAGRGRLHKKDNNVERERRRSVRPRSRGGGSWWLRRGATQYPSWFPSPPLRLGRVTIENEEKQEAVLKNIQVSLASPLLPHMLSGTSPSVRPSIRSCCWLAIGILHNFLLKRERERRKQQQQSPKSFGRRTRGLRPQLHPRRSPDRRRPKEDRRTRTPLYGGRKTTGRLRADK